MRYLSLLVAGLLLVQFTQAQNPDDEKEQKRLFRSYFLAAEEYFYMEDYDEAIFNYAELLKLDPGNYNLNFLMGACYLSKIEGKVQAIPFLEQAIEGVTTGYREGSYKEKYAPREAWFAMARAYQVNYELDKAVEFYEKYRNAMFKSNFADVEYVNKQIASCQTARRMMKKPVSVKYTSLGQKTSQQGNTYNAIISGNGNRLIYMNDRPFFRAILMTDRTGGEWTQPRVINQELWAEGYSFPTSLSMDGNELYLANRKGSEGDIYVSHYRNGKWTPMVPLNDEINTDYYETHACISPGGKELYFTSDRPGGQGGLDIYVSEREVADDWGPAKNLGSKINSFYNEETPFITTDNKTLFFSSQGHTTMGGYDIFLSNRLPDASWSVPANIGYPVSTTDDDLFYVPRKNKPQGLYSLVIPEKNPARAIYSVSLGEPESNVQIGFRTEEQPLEDSISIDEMTVEVDTSQLSEGTGTLSNVLPGKDSMQMADNTTGRSENRGGNTPAGEEVTGVALQTGLSGNIAAKGGGATPAGSIPNPAREYYILNSLFFDYDAFSLNEAARAEAERILTVMRKYPGLKLEVTGHTDARGAADYNLQLSGKRAQSVVDYLTAHGIEAGRLVARGVGEAAPVAMDYLEDGTDSPEGRKLNRHVDLRLYNLDDPDVKVAGIFVPDNLRPRNDYNYSVLLQQSDTYIDSLPEAICGEDISMVIIGNQYLYTAGNYNNRAKTLNLLNNAIDSGFPEAQMMEKRQLEALMVSLLHDTISPELTFTIQFMALKKPRPVSYFKDLSPVTKFEGKDGLTRYVYGEFKEIDIAFKELKEVRKNGYHDAFIMCMARYRAPRNQ